MLPAVLIFANPVPKQIAEEKIIMSGSGRSFCCDKRVGADREPLAGGKAIEGPDDVFFQ